MEFTIDVKFAIYLLGIFAAWLTSYITNKVQTKANTEKIEKLEKENEKLKEKCDLMIEKDTAYASFITKEILELHLKSIEQKIDSLVNLLKEGK